MFLGYSVPRMEVGKSRKKIRHNLVATVLICELNYWTGVQIIRAPLPDGMMDSVFFMGSDS